MKGGAVCYRGKEGREGGLGMLGVCNFRGSGREGLLEKGSHEANLKGGFLHKALWEHPGVGLNPPSAMVGRLPGRLPYGFWPCCRA